MNQPSNAYWEKRARQRMASYHRDADPTIQTITAAYERAAEDLTAEINKIFNTFGKNAELDAAETRKFLNEQIPNPLLKLAKKWYPRVENERIKKWLLNRMNAPAYRARITRLQALREQIYLQSKLIADVEISTSARGYVQTINEGYYRTLFDIQQGLGVGFEFAVMPNRTVETILMNPWSGEHFSTRIWNNTGTLAESLNKIITAGFMSGIGNAKLIQEIEKMFGVGEFAAARLVRTETTYMANAGEMESYTEAGIDEYMFIATLDSRTSEICRDHDRHVYKVKDAVPGKNMPPLHVFCRSSTRAYFGPKSLEGMQRRARDPETGKSILVPASMSYGEWARKYNVPAKGAKPPKQIEFFEFDINE
ncbi:hypothetical protein BK138_16145 [Paenibacillus rhizosphaerae]|uniref:Phage head morphogenesis domain-containing protein n=1 Tax=Paenibacillus rhizosphaerae TaxID=297318 RepID=A0A1R1ESC8_9BACL|nr:minor capsid protein [Paenibacillus rhizosphaerae]OMF54688.1 hypothetical protein BK138_16145 [Paenibacillus rhizosphaerae]